jgi:translocation and assembly module TamB
MWGCMKWLAISFGGLLIVLLVIVAGGWWYLGSSSFAGLVATRIEKTLEARLGREVWVGPVQIERGRNSRIIINGLRIANPVGSSHPYFATVRQLVITGGIDSFWGRKIRVGRIDVVEPHLNFEVYPAGSRLVHNFPHWQSGPPSRFEIYHLDLGTMFITHGVFEMLDRAHQLSAVATDLSSTIKVTSKEDLYAGIASSPSMTVRIQDYEPFSAAMRGEFRVTPGALDLQSLALEGGPDLRVFVSGKVAPLADAVYNLRVTSQLGLARVRQIFRVQKTLDGPLQLDAMLRGRQGTFTLQGGWISPRLRADAYELRDARGRLDVTDKRMLVDVQRASYGGGTVSAHYSLPGYDEPYPMSVDLRYNGVSIEKLFSDWGVQDTGLRGGATGRLSYHWEKDRVLTGAGEGTATLSKNAAAFSNAKYPIAVGGSADFSLENGVVTFKRGELLTDASQIGFTGKLRIEDLWTDLLLKIRSSDFSELDRAGYNFAHSAGKKTFELLGLGGAGDITGSVKGKLKAADVVAHIVSSGTKYNNILLGEADIDLKYDGVKGVMTFDRAVFRDGNSRMTMSGTVGFPDKGPSPQFDLAIDAVNYPVDRATAVVNLKFKVKGLGTGRMLITGTPDEGKVTFAGLTVKQPGAELTLRGSVAWFPGQGTTRFDLDIAATDFPIADIVSFLDLGNVPVTGRVTGTIHLAGPKSELEGQGQLTVRNGSVYGEPVDLASANIIFTKGSVKATNISVAGPAGKVAGEGEFNFNTQKFSYSIQSSSIDLSKLKVLSSLAGLLGGNITLRTTGAGTVEQPEVVLEATLNQATLRGLNLPPDAPPPQLYLAIRNGRLIVRGSAGGVVTIEGDGALAPDGTIDGLVRIQVIDIAKALAMSPKTASLPAAGKLTADLKLGGKLSSIEALRIDATFPEFNLKVSEHDFAPVRPLRASLRDGRLVFDDINLSLKGAGSTFGVSGFAELTGAKRMNIDLRGTVEAALLQLFVPDLRADGHINVAGGVRGTLANPALTGSAEFENAQVRLPGFPQLIDRISGRVVFREDRIDLEALHASLGGGTVVAGGSVSMNGLTPQRARITLQGNGVAIRYFEGITVEGNFTLLLSGSAERMMLQGDVDVTRALYFRDIDIGTALLNAFLTRRSVTPVVAASWQDRLGLNLHLTGANTLAVRNNIADFTGSGDIQVSGTLANPVVLGLITLNEGGKVRFQNIDYRLVRGSINFQNPFRLDPFFDVSLEARVSGGLSELESGPLDVTVTVTGTIDRITPTITSDPPASDITLFSLLGMGGLVGRGGANQQPLDANLAGRSLLFQSLSLLGSRVLSFADAFAIDPGDLSKTGDTGTKVSFEKRLSNNLRVLVVYNTKDGRNRIAFEWQVNPDWVLTFTRDQLSNEYRGEARFRRRYEGHWAWGTRGRNPMALFARFHEVSKSPPPPQQPPDTAASAIPPATGALVTTVDFRSDRRFDTSVLKQYVSVQPGQPLSVRGVQSSIKALFATGDFRDIRVETAAAPGGVVALTFALFTTFRVGDVHFDGLGGADRERASRELTVHLGDVLSLNAVEHSAVAVEDFLHRSGYLEATVDPETNTSRETSRAIVIFHVIRGERAKVGSVNISGDVAPFTSPELIKTMKSGPGKRFQTNDARDDAERMARYMIRRDHRKADVEFTNYVYDKPSKTVALNYRAVAGPIVKAVLVGDAPGAVRRLLPFARNQAYSEDVIDTAANNMTNVLQQNGYYNATVETEEKLVGGIWTVTFHVTPGQQFRLAAVNFTGNQKVPEKTLRSVIATAPPSGIRGIFTSLFHRGGGLTRKQINDDRDTLQSYYLLQGFSIAQVGAPVVTTHPENGTMTVTYPIVEGPQTIVTAVAVEGVEQVAAKSLPKLTLKPGDALNPQIERNDVVALQTFYADRGNAEVQIKARDEVSEDKTSAKVTYVIAEGPKIAVDEVIVRGNTYTTTNTILRTAGIKKADPFSFTSILEAQRNLYRLGIFRRVDVQPEQAGTSIGQRNVTISVEEGKDLTVAGSAGLTLGTASTIHNKVTPIGSVSIAHRNLFGTARYLGLELILAGNNRKEAFLTYREPHIGPYDIPVQMTLFQSDTKRLGAHLRQRGTFIEATRVARYQTRWSLRYEYRISECIIDNPTGDVCALLANALLPGYDRSITNIKISSLTPTFFWDKRDDSIDPHRGFFTSASVEYAFRALAANAHFLKEFAQASWYLPVSTRSVFAVSGRTGVIQDLGGEIGVGGQRLSGVPLSERFTSGGETSHRAFPLDLLGYTCADPADAALCTIDLAGKLRGATLVDVVDDQGRHTIAPLGGRSIVVFNAEYRFPIASNFGGTLFTDVGNVFDSSTPHLDHLRYGVGTGLRYLSPVGPVRFDFGYKLNRRILRFDSAGKPVYERPFAYFITLGYAF